MKEENFCGEKLFLNHAVLSHQLPAHWKGKHCLGEQY